MKIVLDGYTLGDTGSGIPISNLAVNGVLVTEQVDVIRSVYKRTFSRGNVSNTITFKTLHGFNSRSSAENFLWSIRSIAPNAGLFQAFVTDGDPNTPVTMTNAVLQSVKPTVIGVAVWVDW